MKIMDIQTVGRGSISITFTDKGETRTTNARWVESSGLDWAWWEVEDRAVTDADITRWYFDRDREACIIKKLEEGYSGNYWNLICEVNGRHNMTRIDFTNGSWMPIQGFVDPREVNEFMANHEYAKPTLTVVP